MAAPAHSSVPAGTLGFHPFSWTRKSGYKGSLGGRLRHILLTIGSGERARHDWSLQASSLNSEQNAGNY